MQDIGGIFWVTQLRRLPSVNLPAAVGRVGEVRVAVVADTQSRPQAAVRAAEVRYDRKHLRAARLHINHQLGQQLLCDGRVEREEQRHLPRTDDRADHDLLKIVHWSDDLIVCGVVVADITHLQKNGNTDVTSQITV